MKKEARLRARQRLDERLLALKPEEQVQGAAEGLGQPGSANKP